MTASRPPGATEGGSGAGAGRSGAGDHSHGEIPRVTVEREATAGEVPDWDARAVDVEGGDIQQSEAWAALRASLGWRVHRLLLDDDSAILGVGWPFPAIGGGRLYLTKGPVTAGAPPNQVAARLRGVAEWAAGAGYDAVFSDAEVPASPGYQALLASIGFRQVEEIGPSRHRLGVPIPPGADDDTLARPIAKTTRQRIFAAERRGMVVACHDGAVGQAPSAEAATALRRFHPLLVETGARRGFAIGPADTAVGWWLAAMAAGHLLLLEASAADGTYLGAAIFFRHGNRLTYGHSGDVVSLRHEHPGTVHLILWRALQLAAREGRRELDLGGVDVAGARREPRPGEPMHGLLEFKRSLGGEWIELAGAHERALRPARVRVGDAVTAAGRAGRRGVARLRGRRP